jgi:hypothetical protein
LPPAGTVATFALASDAETTKNTANKAKTVFLILLPLSKLD